ncbi:MAG: hypothetical protein V4787_15815 [Pseudomonadota bacterium]
MQYTISMTSRMIAIAAFCAFLLCVLLFLLGIELGKRFADPSMQSVPSATVATPTLPAMPAAPAAPTVAAPSVTAPTVTAPAIKP